MTLFVLVRLVATFRQLEDARRELRDRAVVRERLRIQTELHRGLGGALSQIVSRADGAARATAEWDVTAATTELRALVGDSSQALADARRLVAGYRASSVRAELEAAVTLLGAAGIEPRVMAEDDAALELADKSSRDAAVIQALRDDTLSGVVIHVGRDDDGLRVRLSAVERAEPRGVDAR